MEVELLYESEVADQSHDFNVEAIELLKKLGLEGQLELYTKSAQNGVTTDAFPFVPATKEELFVYAYNFPKCTKVDKFKSETIPLRVLEVLDLAKQTGRFCEFMIMSPQDNTVKDDPVLVGIIKEKEYTYNCYLLARWGNALQPYSELKKLAIEGFKEKFKESCSRAAAELAKLMSMSDSKLINSVGVSYNEHGKYIRGSLSLPYMTVSTTD